MNEIKIKEIRNLNNIKRRNRCGIYKIWVLKNKTDHNVVCDCMQKISYCIEDLNQEIKELGCIKRRNVIYIIMLTMRRLPYHVV